MCISRAFVVGSADPALPGKVGNRIRTTVDEKKNQGGRLEKWAFFDYEEVTSFLDMHKLIFMKISHLLSM